MPNLPSAAVLAVVAEALVRVEAQREKCPRAAALLDDVGSAINAQGAVPATANNEEALLWKAFLEGAMDNLAMDLVKGKELTDEDEAYVRERLKKGGI